MNEEQQSETSNLSTINLVKHYINICNTAISQNQDNIVFGTVLNVINQLKSGETIGLKVTDVKNDQAEYFTTRFVNGSFTPIEIGKDDVSDTQFSMTRTMLQDVVKNDDDYITHPEKLDWSWITADE